MKDRTIISFDYAIKYLLRDPADFTILSGFLSELLGRQVVVEAILESEGNKEREDAKVNRIDLKAQIDRGELVVFEIQYRNQADFFGKVLFDTAKAIVDQISKSERYNVKKVYSINIAYHNFGAEREYQFIARLSGFKGVHYDETISFAQAYGLSSLPKLKNDIHPEYILLLPNKFDEVIRSKFDEWMHVLKTSEVKSEFTAQGLKEAAEKLDVLKMSREEHEVYERYRFDRMNEESIIDTAVMDGIAEGLVLGEAKGHVKGRAEGLAEGEAKGRAEALISVAKTMKANGMDTGAIAKMTGLSTTEIEGI